MKKKINHLNKFSKLLKKIIQDSAGNNNYWRFNIFNFEKDIDIETVQYIKDCMNIKDIIE